MIRYVLDTDILSLLQWGNENVVAHVRSYSPEEIATTVICVEEQLSGWYRLLRRAKSAHELVPIYERMTASVRFLGTLPLLTFTAASADIYEQLHKQKRRTGRMDLRIAAIAISHGAVLVTRNLIDFEGIEGLAVADWTKA
jgi:tRNA(fMet)-specific endonuclease VapC